MVWENGLLVYRTGKPLPSHVVDDAILRSREERSLQILALLVMPPMMHSSPAAP
jgi:hypothetical protein